jgi:hypothetical protein
MGESVWMRKPGESFKDWQFRLSGPTPGHVAARRAAAYKRRGSVSDVEWRTDVPWVEAVHKHPSWDWESIATTRERVKWSQLRHARKLWEENGALYRWQGEASSEALLQAVKDGRTALGRKRGWEPVKPEVVADCMEKSKRAAVTRSGQKAEATRRTRPPDLGVQGDLEF